MIKVVVTEIEIHNIDKRHLRYIKFDMDDGKPCCYRSRVSFGAFFHSKYQRNHSPRHIYCDQREEQFDNGYKIWQDMMARHPGMPDIYQGVPTIEVDNLWEFYKLVRYDYKAKRWTAIYEDG